MMGTRDLMRRMLPDPALERTPTCAAGSSWRFHGTVQFEG
jgi:hypothetical protein